MFDSGEYIGRDAERLSIRACADTICDIIDSDIVLAAAIELENLTGGREWKQEPIVKMAKTLQACGFHALASFMREEPYWQRYYVILFFREFFDETRSARRAEDVYRPCEREYKNLDVIRTTGGRAGDLDQSMDFLLRLHRALLALRRNVSDFGKRSIAA